MKKIVLLSFVLIVSTLSVFSQDTDAVVTPVYFVKLPGSLTAQLQYYYPLANNIHWQIQICNSKNFDASVFTTGWDSGIIHGTKIVPYQSISDTDSCNVRIISWHTDSLGVIHYDTSKVLVMSKRPWILPTTTTTSDSISFFYQVYNGNNDSVPVYSGAYLDNLCTIGIICPIVYINGPNIQTITGKFPAQFNECTHYWVRFIVANPITGSDTVIKMVQTTCPPPPLPEVVQNGTPTVTAHSVGIPVKLNCYAHNATLALSWHKVGSSAVQTVSYTGIFDTTFVGWQFSQPTVSGLEANTSYVFNVSITNVTGTTYMSSITASTLDTVPTFGATVSAITLGNLHIACSIAFGNNPGRTEIINLNLLKDGNVLTTYTMIVDSNAGIIDTGFVVSDYGTYQISGLIFDDSDNFAVLNTVDVTVRNTAGVADIVKSATPVSGTIFIYNLSGQVVYEEKILNQKINSENYNLQTGIYIFKFISFDGKVFPPQKIFIGKF